MTIALPKPNLGDRILFWMGKRRAIHIPMEVYKTHGPYVYAQARRESFIRALLRPGNMPPPAGWIYMDDLPSVDQAPL